MKTQTGSAGGERLANDAVEACDVDAFLEDLAKALRDQTIQATGVLQRYFPVSDGKRRPLWIPMVDIRVVRMAAKLVLEPIFEADRVPWVIGFRLKRSATMAKAEMGNMGGSVRTGRNPSVDEASTWTRDCFHHLGLRRLRCAVVGGRVMQCSGIPAVTGMRDSRTPCLRGGPVCVHRHPAGRM